MYVYIEGFWNGICVDQKIETQLSESIVQTWLEKEFGVKFNRFYSINSYSGKKYVTFRYGRSPMFCCINSKNWIRATMNCKVYQFKTSLNNMFPG